MNAIINLDTYPVVAHELNIPLENVESYFRNYYINRTLPIRDLTAKEMSLVKYYEEIKFYGKTDLLALCAQFKLTWEQYQEDAWIIPKHLAGMTDDEYNIAKKYSSVILEPYLNYKQFKAPRFKPLSKEEIAMLLSNIAVGVSIIPDDQITVRVSMEAMDRLISLYETLPKNHGDNPVAAENLKKLSPKQLEIILYGATKNIEKKDPIKKLIKAPRKKKTKK